MPRSPTSVTSSRRTSPATALSSTSRSTPTAFFTTVWHRLLAIPFGTTVSYGELARELGRPTAARAVGTANGRNPIAIIVPCHRVIGSSGALTGYAGGIERKRYLLRHEAEVVSRSPHQPGSAREHVLERAAAGHYLE